MKEYSQRTVKNWEKLGNYLTEQSKEGWDVLHIQKGAGSYGTWYMILVRDSEQGKEVKE